jgi:chaperone required for assembly of F1-ATPase
MTKKPKRFYKSAFAEKAENGFVVMLDGKPFKTGEGNVLTLPTRACAEAIAAEWQAQKDEVDISSMRITQMAVASAHHMEREATIQKLLAYAGSDVLCYRVEKPEDLRKRQDDVWQPPLNWLNARYGIALNVTTGLTALNQPPEAKQRFAEILEAMDNRVLMGVMTAALATASLVLALMLREKAMTHEAAFAAAELESTYQMESWGEDVETAMRRDMIAKELAAAAHWFALVSQEHSQN